MMSGLWQGNYLTCCAAVRLIGYRNVLERFSQLSKIIDKLQEMCPYSLANMRVNSINMWNLFYHVDYWG